MRKGYQFEEIFGEPGSGLRSLHDDGRRFAREVLKIDLGSIGRKKLPSVKTVVKAFKNLTPGDEAWVDLVESLKMTPILVGASGAVKGTLSGLLWQAAQQVVLFSDLDSEEEEDQEIPVPPPKKVAKTKNKRGVRPKRAPRKKAPPPGSTTRTPPVAAQVAPAAAAAFAPISPAPEVATIAPVVAPVAPVAVAPPAPANVENNQRGGRQKGAKNWSDAEEMTLLQLVRREKPMGAEMWNEVANYMFEEGQYVRTGEVYKKRFERMAAKKAPTGVNVMPVNIAFAKTVMEELLQHEYCGRGSLNDNTQEEEDDVLGVDGTNMFEADTDGRQRPVSTLRPIPKKAKIADGLKSVAQGVEKVGGEMSGCVKELVGVLKENLAPSGTPLLVRENPPVVSAERNSRLDVIESRLDGVDDNLSEILVLLKSNNQNRSA